MAFDYQAVQAKEDGTVVGVGIKMLSDPIQSSFGECKTYFGDEITVKGPTQQLGDQLGGSLGGFDGDIPGIPLC